MVMWDEETYDKIKMGKEEKDKEEKRYKEQEGVIIQDIL